MRSQRPILVVDDDPTIRDLLASVFRDEGYAVVLASNGQEALDRLDHEAPALILLDVMMPIMGGREFLHQWRGREATAVPVVVLSADRTAPAWVPTSGAAACLPKPFALDDLLAQVARCLAGPEALPRLESGGERPTPPQALMRAGGRGNISLPANF